MIIANIIKVTTIITATALLVIETYIDITIIAINAPLHFRYTITENVDRNT